MIKNPLRLFTIFFLTVLVSNAQDFDFGKVSKAELEEKMHPRDTSASAAYLYKNRNTFYEYSDVKGVFELITEVHERIKFYDKEEFDFATKKINLYVGSNNASDERITALKAVTYNLINGKIEETKLKKDGIFNTEVSKYWKETKFTMPNVKEGSVIDYKYRITSPFVHNVDEFIFQHSIPVNKIDAKFSSPEYYNFRANVKGFLAVAPKATTKSDKLRINSKARSGGGGYTTTQTSFNSSQIDYTKNVQTYSLENVPALKDEPYVNNLSNYRSGVKYELSFIKFPEAPIKYYSTSWEDVVKTIYESPNFGGELKKTGYFEKDIDALVSSISNPMEKAGAIFSFVKSKVKWNNYIGKYTDDGVRSAYKSGIGNVSEINLMLTSMLRYVGLDANPILVSTRGNGVPIFPTIEGYNYVIVGVNTGNGIILLDASDKYSMPNVLPVRTLNWEGRMIKKSGATSLVNLYPNQLSSNTVNISVNMDANGTIVGKMRKSGTLHKAKEFRERYNEADEDDYIEKLENRYAGMEISEFEVKNAKDFGKAIMESFSFTLENQADVIGDKIYFSPLLFLRTSENPFKLEKREFPVDFRYPSKSTQRVLIKLPDGYKVESLPESKAVSLPENLGSFGYQISGAGTDIQLVVKTSINSALISSVYYDGLKEYFKIMVEKEAEKIVLIKE